MYVTALAELLTSLGEVTIVTSDAHRVAAMSRPRGSEPDEFPFGVDLRFVEEPGEELASTGYRRAHEWSARVCAELRRLCSESHVDVIEFPDWGGEACVTT